MKRLVMLTLVLLLVGCQLQATPITILDQDTGFSFPMPRGWRPDASQTNSEVESSWRDSDDKARITVKIIDINPDQKESAKDMERYGVAYLDYLKKDVTFADFSLDRHGKVTIDGQGGYEYIFTAKQEDSRWHRLVLVPHPMEPRFFRIDMTTLAGSQDSYSSSFDTVLEGWKWKERKSK